MSTHFHVFSSILQHWTTEINRIQSGCAKEKQALHGIDDKSPPFFMSYTFRDID